MAASQTPQETELLARIEALRPDQRRLLEKRIREIRERELRLRAEPRAPGDRLPLTPGQLRLWRVQQSVPGTPVDVVCQVVRLDGAALDAGRLERALDALVARHEALRTVFDIAEGEAEPRQRVLPELRVPLERIDLPEGGAAEELDRAAAGQSWQPFDLAAGPLLRWTLARLAPERYALLFTIHNLVFDAWSFNVLLEELTALYDGAALPPAPLQPLDFAAWQRRWLAGAEGRRQIEDWRRQLAPPLPPAFPTDRPRDGERRRLGRRIDFTLPPEVREALVGLGRREGATPFMTLAALVQVFVRARAGGDDVVIGTLNANRSRPETAGIVGYLLNIVPLRASLSGDLDFAGAVQRVRKAAREAQARADIPYETLAAELPAGEPHRNPLFDVLFIFENIPPAGYGPGGAALTTHDVDKGAARFDLTVALYDTAGGLEGWIEVDTDLFEEATAQNLAGELQRLAAAVAAHPKMRLRELA